MPFIPQNVTSEMPPETVQASQAREARQNAFSTHSADCEVCQHETTTLCEEGFRLLLRALSVPPH